MKANTFNALKHASLPITAVIYKSVMLYNVLSQRGLLIRLVHVFVELCSTISCSILMDEAVVYGLVVP